MADDVRALAERLLRPTGEHEFGCNAAFYGQPRSTCTCGLTKRQDDVTALARAVLAQETRPTCDKRAFIAGWHAGYYDGGEHDCRMFRPSAERAWEDYQRSLQRQPAPPDQPSEEEA